MAYFPDLSPYSYGRQEEPGVVHVGWLDNVHPFIKGKVPSHLVDKLKMLAKNPVELYRGKHICELCSKAVTWVPIQKDDPRYEKAWRSQGETRHFCPEECMSNGEIRINTTNLFTSKTLTTAPSNDPALIGIESNLVFVKKTTFAAPILIVHYIETHDYLPPAEFLKALEEMPI